MKNRDIYIEEDTRYKKHRPPNLRYREAKSPVDLMFCQKTWASLQISNLLLHFHTEHYIVMFLLIYLHRIE